MYTAVPICICVLMRVCSRVASDAGSGYLPGRCLQVNQLCTQYLHRRRAAHTPLDT
jgi:hypothetical protein